MPTREFPDCHIAALAAADLFTPTPLAMANRMRTSPTGRWRPGEQTAGRSAGEQRGPAGRSSRRGPNYRVDKMGDGLYDDGQPGIRRSAIPRWRIGGQDPRRSAE